MFGKFMRLMEDAAEGGEGGGSGSEAAAGNETQGGLLASAAAEEQDQQAAADDRPDYISENFWDAENKSVRIEELAKSQRDLRSKLTEKYGDDFVKAMTEVPASADDYKISTVPEGMELAPTDPLYAASREAAKRHNIPAGAFDSFMSDVLGAIAKINAENAPDSEKVKEAEKAAIAEEKAKLGPNADKILTGVWNWAKGFVKIGLWTEQEFNEVVGMGMSAEGARALAKLQQHFTRGEAIPTSASPTIQTSEQEAYAMLRDPKYGTDAAYTAKVKQVFKDVFGEDPATTSKKSLGL